MSKRSGDLVKYAKFLVEAGVMERPVWLAALERVPPPPLPRPGRRPPTISFPEDGQVTAYYARHPQARLEALDIASFEPPAARRVAFRVTELLGQGVAKGEAVKTAEAEAAAADAEARQGSAKAAGIVEQIQAEEEASLRRAIQLYTTRNPDALVAQQAAAAARKQQQRMKRPPPGAQRVPGSPPPRPVVKSATTGSA